MAWFNAVSLAGGGLTAGQLEVLFGSSNTGKTYTLSDRSGLWGKYRTGYICPKTKPDLNGRISIVERVEKKFPGTAKWLTLPFWDVLSYTPMTIWDLKKIYCSFPPALREMFVMEIPGANMMFWRKRQDPLELCRKLIELGGIDALTAILALIKEAETIQYPELHLLGLEAWAHCSETLQIHPVLGPLQGRINDVLLDRFTRVSYPFPNEKVRILSKREQRF